ncbi:hypothetical protein Vafri_19225 [Volvox africanus]|uniref:Uncharacterized protein n=1 Tax=Volvox africanus TaxID=51714 RepID=A0A8J4BR98_9CHLO|nr:hypothetical protein Vafri_19225 [Volvox africanus]
MLHSRGLGSSIPCIASAALEPLRAANDGTLRGRSSASSARRPSEDTSASATPPAPLAPEDRSCKPSERNGWREGQGAARLAMRVRVAATRRQAASAARAAAAVPGSLETRYAASANTAAIWYDSASSWPRRSMDSAGPYTCSSASATSNAATWASTSAGDASGAIAAAAAAAVAASNAARGSLLVLALFAGNCDAPAAAGPRPAPPNKLPYNPALDFSCCCVALRPYSSVTSIPTISTARYRPAAKPPTRSMAVVVRYRLVRTEAGMVTARPPAPPALILQHYGMNDYNKTMCYGHTETYETTSLDPEPAPYRARALCFLK